MRLAHSIVVPIVLVVLGACGGGGDTNSSPTSPSTPSTPSAPSTPSTPAAPVATEQVELGHTTFTPANIPEPVNATVMWTWGVDATTHYVSGSGGLSSGDKTAGDSYTKAFTSAGTFFYSCTIHPGMAGSVLVTP